ncbi:MAG: general secretion pathway protein GspB [Proteobacteria bacterium]|nr:general secretion pathway protein GspB [Pseudomonadota bacterium]MBU1688083.1 general secretion pathway protein GspB [Pseudomonadota bacterium]
MTGSLQGRPTVLILLVLLTTGIITLMGNHRESSAADAQQMKILRSARPDTEPIRPTQTEETEIMSPRDPFNWPPDEIARREQGSAESIESFWQTFTLNGILWTERLPVAVINNRELHLGDSLNGAVIQEITPDTVILATPGSVKIFRFPTPALQLNNSLEAK